MTDSDSNVGDLVAAVDDARQALDDIAGKLQTSRTVQWVLGALGAVLVALVLVLSVTVVRLNAVIDDVKESQIAGCERGNQFRADMIVAFEDADRDFAEALAQVTGATPERLEEFLAVLDENREAPDSLRPVDCEAVY